MKNTTRMALMVVMMICTTGAKGQNFDVFFEDATLRLDYIMGGNANQQYIFLHDLKKQDRWAGRRGRLTEAFVRGNGQLTMKDHDTQQTIYVHTFSTLFQEWLQYPEAQTTNRSYETAYNVPFPKKKVDITISLTDVHAQEVATMTHTVDPTDILIRKIGNSGIPFQYIWKGDAPSSDQQQSASNEPDQSRGRNYVATPYDPFKGVNLTDCVDLAIVAEGYTEAQMGKFYQDAQRATDALFEREPFRSLKHRFNVVAVGVSSTQSGPSVPHFGVWNNTAANTHYDTFYTERYLTTKSMHHIYDILADVPFEQIIVMLNSDTYGGGGIYNQITTTTSDHATFKQVLVHEFGHTYAALGDEYAYDDMSTEFYPADTEPWEPNLTTLKDFESKWADLMPKNQPIPTPLDPNVPNFKEVDLNDAKAREALNRCTQVVGVFEGAGYQSKGCYRPAQECRMKVNEVDDFCPVCARAIRRVTDYNTAK